MHLALSRLICKFCFIDFLRFCTQVGSMYGSSLFLQSLLRRISIPVAMGILLLPQPQLHFKTKTIQRSGEIGSDIQSYGEWKYNIYLPNCIKNSKNSSSVFGDFRFPKCLTSFFFPQIFGGYCTHQLLQKQKKNKLHFMPCKAHNLELYPSH